ncbi:MAG: tRNA 2-thiocytidine biosynthesis TtcA family protein, partial [Syntrophomonadaceae bacterium]|nr:tRNA 2-thiocytidine biosynthesis TtcA family protein [Syntrophomonadaceae bacterium]
ERTEGFDELPELLAAYTPLKFSLLAVTVDLGWGDDLDPLRQHCETLGVPMVVEPTGIGPLVFEQRGEANPCALCSHLRRGALARVASSHGCNKVALGHHLDDAVVTLLMSMAMEGRFRCFRPSTPLSRSHLTVIRPLVYVEEELLAQLGQHLAFPVITSRCPAAGDGPRRRIQAWVQELERQFPGSRQRMLHALENADPHSFWRPPWPPSR